VINTCNGRVLKPCTKVQILDGVVTTLTVVLPSLPDVPEVPDDPDDPDDPDVPDDASPNVIAA